VNFVQENRAIAAETARCRCNYKLFRSLQNQQHCASTLCLQPSHLTMTLNLKDTITPQSYINYLSFESFPILCSSITDFSKLYYGMCVAIDVCFYVYIFLLLLFLITYMCMCFFMSLLHFIMRNKVHIIILFCMLCVCVFVSYILLYYCTECMFVTCSLNVID